MDSINITAEIVKVEAKKLASLDISYQITIRTSDMNALSLAMLPGDQLVQMNIKLNTDNNTNKDEIIFDEIAV